MSSWQTAYEHWRTFQDLDPNLKEQLDRLHTDQESLEDAFYKELEFGTGGMRGIIGPGRNRMNIYTIRRVVYGLGNYLLKNNVNVKDRGVVVAYDSRHMSQEFAVEVAKVLGTFGIKTHIFTSLRPTPLLSFAIRYLGTVSGIMITASHNPPEYNGFKVYNDDGGQLVPRDAEVLIDMIQENDDELTIPVMEQEDLKKADLLTWIGDEIDHAYLEKLQGISKWPEATMKDPKDLPIVFTPLHGTAHNLVMQGLKQMNFTNVHVVREQAIPDPEFSTVASPNPEEHQAFEMAIEVGKKWDAAILLGTDPDADRLGVAVRDDHGEYTVLTGNQLGSLLLDYILSRSDTRILGDARMMKTIVTTELGRRIAEAYGVETMDVLTGFKYISEKIRQFDETGETFVFGFEESYGYLISPFSRDKDAVQAAVMATEMAAYWHGQGMTLLDALHALHDKYGYYMEGMSSLKREGKAGVEQIQLIMDTFRNERITDIAGLHVDKVEDYQTRERLDVGSGKIERIDLPEANVLKFILEGNGWVCLRPSGTEPKIKCYYGVCSDSEASSRKWIERLKGTMDHKMQTIIQDQ